MRRYILFLLFLCLHWTARGQTDFEYRYWFDKDESSMKTGTSDNGNRNIDVDISGLSCSMHFIHIQVKGQEGDWSAPVTRNFVKYVSDGLTGYYWIDKETAVNQQQIQSPYGKLDLDISGLDDGLHCFYFHAGYQDGTYSPAQVRFFVKKTGVTGENWKYRYWIDKGGQNVVSGQYTGEPVMLDVSDIDNGFHLIYFQVESSGSASLPVMSMFLKVPQTDNTADLTCLCFIDGELFEKEMIPSGSRLAGLNLDVAGLSQGLHHMLVQVVMPDGSATNVADRFFLRSVTDEEYSGMKLYYSLDGKDFCSQADGYCEGLYHFDIDVTALEDGEHTITYFLAADNGTSTDVCTASFIKVPVEQTGIGICEDDFSGKVDVYGIDGKIIRKKTLKEDALEGLRPGIYIIGNTKIVKEK